MSDTDLLERVLGMLDPGARDMGVLRRGGRLLLCLPADRGAAARTLRLYQPQRFLARASVTMVDGLIRCGWHGTMLPKVSVAGEVADVTPALAEIAHGTCGVMLGSPEHRVRRAIASFKTANGWEVAKIAFGCDGWEVIGGEVDALRSLPENMPGIPTVLGVHRGTDLALMRMPYFQGRVLGQDETAAAVALLDSWRSHLPAKPLREFPEWPVIERALGLNPNGGEAVERLSRFQLRPVIRHGDFARWNLLRTDRGDLMVLDWEWAVASGMPGIDLIHFFAQEARLVKRQTPMAVIRSVERSLQRDDCRNYLAATGWQGDARAAILASIAFTGGSGQQSNGEVLAALLDGC